MRRIAESRRCTTELRIEIALPDKLARSGVEGVQLPCNSDGKQEVAGHLRHDVRSRALFGLEKRVVGEFKFGFAGSGIERDDDLLIRFEDLPEARVAPVHGEESAIADGN